MQAVLEQYVQSVMRLIPRVYRDRARVEQDLRSHLADRVAAGATEAEAVAQMGPAADIAREFVRDLPTEYASAWRRAAAYVLDMVALGAAAAVVLLLVLSVIAVMWVIAGTCGDMERGANGSFATGCGLLTGSAFAGTLGMVLFLSVFFVLLVLYFPILEAWSGQTVGKWALGLYVVDETGLRIGFGTALLRRIPSYLQFFWVDAIFAFFTKAHQRAFDIVAHTVVIRRR